MGDQRLADFLGISREHVSRSRSSLLEKGLVEKVEGGFVTSQKWYDAVTFKSVTKHHNEEEGVQNVTESGQIVTSLLIDKEIKKDADKSAYPSFSVIKDSPTPKGTPRDKAATTLLKELYALFEKEYGSPPTPTAADYFRVVAALKKLDAKKVVWLVEERLEGKGAPRTVREALTARSIDVYLQDN